MHATFPPVVILCGGLGTRLRPVVDDRPKVLASVAGRPFLGYVLDWLAGAGASDIVLSAGHMADQIEDFAATGTPAGVSARVVAEESPLGTAGALRFATHAAGIAGDFLAINGDTFFSGSPRRLAAAHTNAAAVATVALVRVPDASRYGAVIVGDDGDTVCSFEEKGVAVPGWINAGVYALSPRALDKVHVGMAASLERDVLPALIGNGLNAVSYPDAIFLDIGTPEDHARAESLLPSGITS